MASKCDGATIEVINWSIYNPRTDSKKPSWFRFENNLATGPSFHGLNCEQKWLWVFILSLVSQKNGEEIVWNAQYCTQLTGISEEMQNSTIEIFEKLVRLRVTRKVTLRCRNAPRPLRTNGDVRDETRRTNETNGYTAPSAAVPTWEAYRDAYQARYGEPPVRNAATNSKIKQFVGRLGAEEAPTIAAFYLTHNSAFYVRTMHALGPMLQDAEKLRTEWATGTKVTSNHVKSRERLESNQEAMRAFLKEKEGAPA